MITIFTPTYNRATTLPRLYNSLLKQTNHKFEWIIIDDGSVDNTEEIVAQFLSNDNPFEIVYKKKSNGGKHRAINDAVKMARYDWFFIVDSDDFIIDTSVEKIISWTKTVEDDNSFAGVAGLRGYIEGDKKIGNYPTSEKYKDFIDATNLQRAKFKLEGDKAEIYKTEILRKYPFPEFEGENFLSEGVVWDSIAKDGYKIRWYNEIIYKCEYLAGGLTDGALKNSINNFEGFTLYSKIQIELKSGIAKQSQIEIYLRVAKKKGLTTKEAASNLGLSAMQVRIPSAIGFAKIICKKIMKR